MNELKIFENEEFGKIRTTEIDGKTYFVANDIAKALGYVNPSDATNKHCKNARMAWGSDSLGRNQEFKVIPEGDIYRLVIKSKLQSAEKFEKWVFDEVLPSIRKNGGYISGQDELNEAELMAKALQVANKVIERRDFAIKLLEEQIKQDKPKVEFFDTVADSKTAVSMEETAKLIGIKGVGRNKLFEFLRNKGVLQRNNVPYQLYVDRGWFNVTEVSWMNKHGEPMVTTKTMVYQKGIDNISKMLKKEYEE